MSTDVGEVPAEVWAGLHERASQRGAEGNIARRLRAELERREWSQETFAAKVRAEGLPSFRQSALSRLFKPQGEPRAITVEEACAFSRVLGIPLPVLLAPEGAAFEMRVTQSLDDLPDLYRRRELAEAEHEEAEDRIFAFLESRDGSESGLRDAILARFERARRFRDDEFQSPYPADEHLLERWEERNA